MSPIVYAIVLVFGTTVIHALFAAALLEWIGSVSSRHWALGSLLRRACVFAALVLVMSLAAFAECGVWAALYLWVGALSEWREALYFSLVSFTTLGYGDIVLGEEWRILAGFEAVNGIILFGCTTAIIMAVAQRLYLRRQDDGTRS